MNLKQYLAIYAKAVVAFMAFVKALGFLFLFGIVLSFTDLPYWAYYNLGTSSSVRQHQEVIPKAIIVLGGSGMPSPDGLIRTYYAADVANRYPSARVIIALPFNENEKDSLFQLNLMAHELIIRGVDSLRIGFEPLGFNTHSQAVNIAEMYKGTLSQTSLLIVTSPEHTYRAVNTFRKAGFRKVNGIPTFEKPVDEIKIQDKEKNKDHRVKSLDLRYNIWSYLQYEIVVAREYCAIGYYKLKGWI